MRSHGRPASNLKSTLSPSGDIREWQRDPIHLVVDSTGAKLYGEGEWKVRQHGYSKRRTWRKMHLGLDANTTQVRTALMTRQDVADGDVLAELLDQILTEERLDAVGGDGAYNSKQCHAVISTRSATPSIPPRDGAVHWKASVPDTAWRNEAVVDTIDRLDRREWKKGCGYHRLSLAGNAMLRLKKLTGPCLWARRIDSQVTGVVIRLGALNRTTERARPRSARIARDHEQRLHFVPTPDFCKMHGRPYDSL